MAINGPIIAASMSPRARARTTAIPIVKAIPPASVYELQESVPAPWRECDTNFQYNRSGGSYTINTIANPVNGAVDADTWTGSSSMWYQVPFRQFEPGFYTYSFYARGITPSPSTSFVVSIQETSWFANSYGTIGSTTVNAAVGVWKRFSLTVYVANPGTLHRVILGDGGTFGTGDSVYLACGQWEEGGFATPWLNTMSAGAATNIYTETTQQPQREGQMVGYISANSSDVRTVNFYVVVNINGTLTWKPVVGISETIDPRTGKPFDPLLDFYSALA